MNEAFSLILSLVTGVVLGVIFFGGLWWTVQKGMTSEWAALWFCGSWLLRTSLTVSGFLIVANGHWERLLVCLFGFVAARVIVERQIRKAEKPPERPKERLVPQSGTTGRVHPSFQENATGEACHAT